MGVAARYAWANRVVLAELVRKDFDSLLGAASSRLVVDVPHNVVLQEDGLNVHRKGATPGTRGGLCPHSRLDGRLLLLGNRSGQRRLARVVRRRSERTATSCTHAEAKGRSRPVLAVRHVEAGASYRGGAPGLQAHRPGHRRPGGSRPHPSCRSPAALVDLKGLRCVLKANSATEPEPSQSAGWRR